MVIMRYIWLFLCVIVHAIGFYVLECIILAMVTTVYIKKQIRYKVLPLIIPISTQIVY